MVRGGNPHQNGVLRFMNYWYNTNVFFENINIEIKEVEESEEKIMNIIWFYRGNMLYKWILKWNY